MFGVSALRIEQAYVAGIAFTGEDVFVIVESEPHKYAVEIVVCFFLLLTFFNGRVSDAAPTFLFVEKNRERVFIGTTIGGDDRFSIGTDGQTPWAGSSGKLPTQRRDHTSSRQDGFGSGPSQHRTVASRWMPALGR